ncbi:permease [Halosquirtibacter xylanolyticus]|uniref:permease n=1 Tax=Halosquirtibacter xylanolyticus TaxID=3374599 RepID=UPI003748AA45|nr:permease [Prolixibacteraceae bacterium]
MISFIQEFFFEFIRLFNEMSIYLMVGFFFAGLLHNFLKKESIVKYLGTNSKKSVFNAAFLGVPLPLCSCGVIPTGLSLYKHGASKGATNAFLISTPQTGVDSLLATYSLMGFPFAIFRAIAAFITGIFGGGITDSLTKEQKKEEIPCQETKQEVDTNFKDKVIGTFKFGFIEFLADISKWLIIGLVLAALISTILPDNFFGTLSSTPLLNMLLVLLASIPIYVCATGSVPIAAVLIMKGLTPGAAFVFLMAGPATNIATLVVLSKTIGKKATIIYLLSIVVGAISFGLIIDYLLPAEWFTFAMNHTGHIHKGVSSLQIISSIVFAILLIRVYILKCVHYFQQRKRAQKSYGDQCEYTIKGMGCNKCKIKVETNLQHINGVESVQVDLSTGKTVILGEHLSPKEIQDKITSLGYKID